MTFIKKLITLSFCITCLMIFMTYSFSIYSYIQEGDENKKITPLFTQLKETNDTTFTTLRIQAINELSNLNSDIVGWISLPNSMIDYPLVQSQTNDYYLNHTIYKEPSKYGSIFIDYRNKLSLPLDLNQNIIIYGHNMKDRQMFGDLNLLKDTGYVEKNRVGQLLIGTEVINFEIFAIYVTSTIDDYLIPQFDSLSNKQSYFDTAKEKSMHVLDSELKDSDVLLTLSTCNYDFHEARLVVHAILN